MERRRFVRHVVEMMMMSWMCNVRVEFLLADGSAIIRDKISNIESSLTFCWVATQLLSARGCWPTLKFKADTINRDVLINNSWNNSNEAVDEDDNFFNQFHQNLSNIKQPRGAASSVWKLSVKLCSHKKARRNDKRASTENSPPSSQPCGERKCDAMKEVYKKIFDIIKKSKTLRYAK